MQNSFLFRSQARRREGEKEVNLTIFQIIDHIYIAGATILAPSILDLALSWYFSIQTPERKTNRKSVEENYWFFNFSSSSFVVVEGLKRRQCSVNIQ